MLFFQFFLLLVILPLSYGPLGRYFSISGGPDLIVLSVWAFVWLTDRNIAVRWAVFLGLAVDLLGFTTFGLWTAFLVALTYLIDWLKLRFFEVSSVFQAMLALFITNVIVLLFIGFLSQNFQLKPIIVSVISNLLIGLLLYYVLAMRYRLFARWEGKRL